MLFNNLVRKYSVAILPLAAMALGGCSEDDEPLRPSAVPAVPGAAIDFSLAQTPASRTGYTDKLQMDWVDGDQVHLFSDQARIQNGTTGLINPKPSYTVGNVSCTYSVNIVDHKYHANLSTLHKDGYSLQWPEDVKEDAIFTFLGAYPVERVANGPAKDSWKFEMHYMTNQRVTVNGQTADREYTTTPDMKNAYIMARDTVVPTGQHVLLHFNPIMTTLDVHIHAHGDDHEIGTGIINGMKITGVSVIMPKRLQHGSKDGKPTFTYDLSNASDRYDISGGRLENGLIADCKQSVYVGIDNGQDPYVMLNEGESLSLIAFLPPVKGDDMKDTKVKIHTAGAYDFVVTLPNDRKWIEEGRIDIDLPKLDPDRNLGNAWMKNLPDNMAMTHLSLPGASCEAGTTAADVTRWLRAGVRVLDMCNAAQSQCDSICDAVAKFLEANKTEFVIVWGDRNGESSDFTKMWTDEDKFGEKCAFADENESTAFTFDRMRSKFEARTVKEARELRVLVLKKGNDHIFNVRHGDYVTGQYMNTTQISRASNINISDAKWNITGAGDGSSRDCQVYYINNGLNLEVAKYLADRKDESTGCAGIIMIPFAGQAFDNNLNQVYGDVLLQTVIDCNYKFIIDLK